MIFSPWRNTQPAVTITVGIRSSVRPAPFAASRISESPWDHSRVRAHRYPAVTHFTDDADGLGQIGANVDRNRIPDIDETHLGIKQAHRSLAVVFAVERFLAGQQPAQYFDFLGQRL